MSGQGLSEIVPSSADGIGAIPSSGDQPVFNEPWQARAFAIVLKMHDDGKFEWKDFQELLIEEITTTEKAGTPRHYYENWFIAAERLVEKLGIAHSHEVDNVVHELRPDDRTIVLPKD